MPRITVNLPSDLVHEADGLYQSRYPSVKVNRSRYVMFALQAWVEGSTVSRPATSDRGRIETLRSLRAARDALDELERGLTQEKPVQRRVRRYTPRSQGQRGT